MNETLQTLTPDVSLVDITEWSRPLAYMLAAMVCANLGRSESLARRTPRKVQRVWLLLSVIYMLAAANALVQGDILWVQWARSFAREQQAYGGRRAIQLTCLLAVLLLIAASWNRLARANDTLTQRTLLLTGGCGTVLLHVLHYVSFHYTDLALNALWLNLSVATWVECASLGMVGVGTGLELLRSHGHV